MSANISPPPKLQFFDANGVPLSGGKLYSYAAGTTTPLATYTDSTGNTANPNPIILDSRGEASVWLGSGLYKLRLDTSTNVTLWTVDNIGGVATATDLAAAIAAATAATLAQLAASGGSNLIGYLPAGTGAVATTVQAKLRESVSPKDYGAVGDGTTNDTSALNKAVSQSQVSSGAITLLSAMSVGSALPSLGGAQFIGNKPITYNLNVGYGKTVANRRGRDLAQKVLGRSYLARFWNYLSFFGVTYKASVYMTGDSVTESYVGPILRNYLLGVAGVASVTNNAIAGTTIEQWRTGTGSFSGSGKSLSDWVSAPTDVLYISFGINTPYYGGTPADFANSLDLAMTTIRASRDITQTSVIVVLPVASADGGAMAVEGGYKRDEYYVYQLRALVEPLVDKHQFCLYDQSLETPEANAALVGVNAPLWLDLPAKVHPIYGYKYFLAGQIFDTIAPWQLRSSTSTFVGAADVAPASGFTLPNNGENMRAVRNMDQVISDGYVQMTTPAALTSGQTIATLSTDYAPARYQWYVNLMLYTAVSGTWENIRGEIDNSTRAIKTSQVSVMSPQRIYLYGAWNAT